MVMAEVEVDHRRMVVMGELMEEEVAGVEVMDGFVVDWEVMAVKEEKVVLMVVEAVEDMEDQELIMVLECMELVVHMGEMEDMDILEVILMEIMVLIHLHGQM